MTVARGEQGPNQAFGAEFCAIRLQVSVRRCSRPPILVVSVEELRRSWLCRFGGCSYSNVLEDGGDDVGILDAGNHTQLPACGRSRCLLSLPRMHVVEFQRLFMARADEVIHDATHLFEFVPKLVDTLARHDIPLGIVSTKFRRRIEAVLRRDNLAGRFELIVGGEDVEVLKPHPA